MAKNTGDKHKLDNKADTPDTPAEEAMPSQVKDFHIVGIGASAGGLEALEQFFPKYYLASPKCQQRWFQMV